MEVKNNCNTHHLCRNGCGFYGSSQFDGMCSKCYKILSNASIPGPDSHHSTGVIYDTVANTEVTAVGQVVETSGKSTDQNVQEHMIAEERTEDFELHFTTSAKPPDQMLGDSIAEVLSSSDKLDGQSPSPIPSTSGRKTPNANRCHACHKRIGLTGLQCRCGFTFCGYHRYTDRHDCTFDYQEQGQNEIRRANPEVKGEKIRKL
ncbi:aspartyl protease [Clonorchis sinensis]|uniref:Zinc finger A20 and AN1 domain-containing stress-associated protein 9 n=2 Tax=Clonorchis sinensis TaxID=79923 RepID=G7YUS2_CLOSI|nr:aspartyl protease [Clonorchis sinensis]GAA56702.1 zinc finger A20 and AN1 domain-containing stress-associated protein 9 [Clonorchis sinensis]